MEIVQENTYTRTYNRRENQSKMTTKDIKLQNLCDHSILGERLYFNLDRKTLNPEFPIASHGSVELSRFGVKVSKTAYTLVQDLQTVYGEKYKKIVLLRSDMYTDALYEISYKTYSQFCPKCQATNYVDDIALIDGGKTALVSGPTSLSQAVEKFIITSLTSNPYYSWIGSGLTSLIGSKITDGQSMALEIQSLIRTALDNLKEAQLEHQSVNPSVGSSEMLNLIEIIDVVQDDEDQSVFNAYVQYTNQNGTSYTYEQVVDLTEVRPR